MKRNFWGMLGLVLLIGLFLILYGFLKPILFGIFIYYISRPIYNILHKYLHSQSISAFITILCVITPFLVGVTYTLYIGIKQLIIFLKNYDASFIVNEIVTQISSIKKLEVLLNRPEVVDVVKMNAYNLINIIPNLIATIPGILLNIFIMFTTAYYLQKDGSKLVKYIIKQLPEKDAIIASKFFSEIDKNLFYLFFSSIANALLTATIAFISFTALNEIAPTNLKIPYVALISMMLGLISLIPLIGIKIVWIPLYVSLLIRGGIVGFTREVLLYLFVTLLVINFVIDMIPDIIVRPVIVGGKRIHNGLLLFSFIFGSIAFGFVGFFLGPMLVIIVTAYFKVVFPELKDHRAA